MDWPLVRTALHSDEANQFFTVTHPFHPWHGRRFELIDLRRRWGQWRVYFLTEQGHTAYLLAKYICRAARQVPSLRSKRLHPHSVRHSSALYLLRSGVDISTIAHWLGHADLNTTNKYLSLDLEEKRQALAKAKTVVKPGRSSAAWRKNPSLIRWLEDL